MTSLSEVLLEKKVITKEQLEKALKRQWEEGGTLEEVLVQLGLLDEDKLVQLIVEITPYRKIDLGLFEVDPEAASHVPKRIAQKFILIPVRKSKRYLAVAMANPLDNEAYETLKQVTDFEIIPFVARISDVKRAIKRVYESEEVEEETPFEMPQLPSAPKMEAPSMKFDDFVVNETNRFAYTLAREIAKGDRTGIVYIVGDVGVGKTHLLAAVMNEIKASGGHLSVVYYTPTSFVAELEAALKSRELSSFRARNSSVDVFLFDDIELLSQKVQAQEVLLYIVDELLLNGKSLMFTSIQRPKDLGGFIPKLKARLRAAILAAIAPPDKDLKLEILKRKLGSMPLDEEVLKFIAENTGNDIRILEGALKELETLMKHTGTTLSKEIAKGILRRYLS